MRNITSRYTYFDQDRGVPPGRMRRRISLETTLVSQRRKHKAERSHTHVGSSIRLQPSLWSERLDVVTEDLSISMYDPWIGPYDSLGLCKQGLSRVVSWESYTLGDEVTVNLDSTCWSDTWKTHSNCRMEAETLVQASLQVWHVLSLL